jgi:hypothetical protein
MQDILKNQEREFTKSDIAVNAREQVVQISRRIDWRFLLPVPEPGDVVLIGSGDEELTVALRHFSSSLKIVSPENLVDFVTENQNRFDLAVVNVGSSSVIKLSNEILKSGGNLYWEVSRKKINIARSGKTVQHRNGSKVSTKPVLFSRNSHFREYKNYLDSVGFKEVEIHWHRPNFKNCKELIPLEAPEALRYVFSRGHSGLKGKIKLLTGRLCYRSGLLPYIVPCFSLVARKD